MLRTTIRAALRDRLGALAHLAGFTEIKAWRSDPDEGELPAWSVATPRESAVLEARDHVERDTSIVVIVKRAATLDDIEDALDADQQALEAAVLTLLRTHADQWAFDGAEIDVKVAGEAAIGTLILTFSARHYTREGCPGDTREE